MISDIDLDHVAVAADLQADLWPRYARDLGGAWVAGGATPGFSSAQVRFANGMKLEALEPYLEEENDFLRRFLDRNGPGPHHLTFKVRDIRAAIEEAEAAGYRPVNTFLDDPMWKETFLHPKDAPGVVVQLAQSSGDWQSDQPDDFPSPRTPAPATLLRVVHAVAELDDGLRLFAGLLAGQEVGRGEDADGRWVELAWPGPGRVRLVEPSGPDTPLAAWIGGWRGRVHHLAFRTDDPAGVPHAHPLAEGAYEVAPGDNLGVRLRLFP